MSLVDNFRQSSAGTYSPSVLMGYMYMFLQHKLIRNTHSRIRTVDFCEIHVGFRMRPRSTLSVGLWADSSAHLGAICEKS